MCWWLVNQSNFKNTNRYRTLFSKICPLVLCNGRTRDEKGWGRIYSGKKYLTTILHLEWARSGSDLRIQFNSEVRLRLTFDIIEKKKKRQEDWMAILVWKWKHENGSFARLVRLPELEFNTEGAFQGAAGRLVLSYTKVGIGCFFIVFTMVIACGGQSWLLLFLASWSFFPLCCKSSSVSVSQPDLSPVKNK